MFKSEVLQMAVSVQITAIICLTLIVLASMGREKKD